MNELQTFLERLDCVFHNNNPKKLLNGTLDSGFLALVRTDRLEEFHGILISDSIVISNPDVADILADVENEIVHRHMVKVPRNFTYLSQFLEARFPDDALSKSMPELNQIIGTYKDDWVSQEAAFLKELRRIEDNESRFAKVITKILHSFSVEDDSRAATYIIFVRNGRPAESSTDEDKKIYCLEKEYLRPTLVRKLAARSIPGTPDSIFQDVITKIADDFVETAKSIQFMLQDDSDPQYSIVYKFMDSLNYMDELYLEGRSGALAIAFLTHAHKRSSLPGYRELSPYVACFGILDGEYIDDNVGEIEEKITAAKENGIRVLVVPKSGIRQSLDSSGCEIIEYRFGSIKGVINSIFKPTADIATSLLEAIHKAKSEDKPEQMTISSEARVSRTTESAFITWSHLKGMSQHQLNNALEPLEGSIAKESKYIPEVYVPRCEIEDKDALFDQFLASEKSILPILGESGYGKTNLLCSLAKNPTLENDYAVMFYEARNLYTSPAQRIRRDLNLNFALEELIPGLGIGGLAGKKLLVFVDAINESGNPKQLLHEIVSLCSQQPPHPSFRIVFSCRTGVWTRLESTLNPDQEASFFRKSGKTDRLYPILSKFEDNELKTAYGKYSEAFQVGIEYDILRKTISSESLDLLREPLILRLFAHSYSGGLGEGVIPRDINTWGVFEKYSETRLAIHGKAIYDNDERFLNRLAECMWQNHTDRLGQDIIHKEDDLLDMISRYLPPEIRFSDMIVCEKCDNKIADENDDLKACPRCGHGKLKHVRTDYRSPYERLLEEGLLVKDGADYDFAIRFKYDRYYEYRTAKWLIGQYNRNLTVDAVKKLAVESYDGKSLMPLEALKQAILNVPNKVDLLTQLATSNEQIHLDMVESCIEAAARGGDKDIAIEILSHLTEIGGQARILAIRVAGVVDIAMEPSDDPLLVPISDGDDSEALSQAVTLSLYGIWLRENSRERGLDLLEHIAESVSPRNLIRGNTKPLLILLDVTLRTLGILHDEPNVVKAFSTFWKTLLTQNLYLGRREIHARGISSIARWGLVRVASGQVTKKLNGYGVTVGSANKDFSKDEIDAILTLLSAMKGNKEAFEKLPDILAEYGLESVNSEKRSRSCAKIVYLLSSSLLAIQAGRDLAGVIRICDELFERSRDFHNNGSGTRYLVYSQLNYAVQLYYKEPLKEHLKTCLDAILRYYKWAIKEDRGSLIKNPISDELSAVTGATFGLFFEVVTRMDGDLNRDIVIPMLQAAEEGYPDLIKSYLGDVSACCLDTFCRRYPAQRHFLKSLDLFGDLDDLASRLNMDAGILTNWLIEAYAVISLRYPTEAESSSSEGQRFDRSVLSRIRQARSQPSHILGTIQSGVSLEQEVNRHLEVWSFADGINSLIVLFPDIQEQMVKYVGNYFNSKYSSMKDLTQHALRDLLDLIVPDH